MRSFRRNQQGLLMYFVVVIMTIVICGVMWFFFADGIQMIQEQLAPDLGSDKFITPGNWEAFDLANTFSNNLWIILLIFVVLGLAYYGYNESQKRSQY